LLLFVIGPISWIVRDQPGDSIWVLAWTLASPLLLALPIGKGFSKPDFWSGDLCLPCFLAVRPISSSDFIVVKLKVAALSALSSWTLIVVFLSFWLSTWGDLSALVMPRLAYWMVYDHSVLPQYVIVALTLLAGLLLTWKFLVDGLWIGLSGGSAYFLGSAFGSLLLAVTALIGLAVALNHDAEVRAWVWADPERLVAGLQRGLALAVTLKVWLTARAWRQASRRQFRVYLFSWLGGVGILVTLALLLWAHGTLNLALMAFFDVLPVDAQRLRNILILAAILAVPFARPALAAAALTRNRHGATAPSHRPIG